jgi:hypothetical protein
MGSGAPPSNVRGSCAPIRRMASLRPCHRRFTPGKALRIAARAPLDPPRGLQSIHRSHVQIHQHQVHRRFGSSLHRRSSLTGNFHDLKGTMFLQESPHGFAQEQGLVHHHNAKPLPGRPLAAPASRMLPCQASVALHIRASRTERSGQFNGDFLFHSGYREPRRKPRTVLALLPPVHQAGHVPTRRKGAV